MSRAIMTALIMLACSSVQAQSPSPSVGQPKLERFAPATGRAAGAFAISRALATPPRLTVPITSPANVFVSEHLAHKVPRWSVSAAQVSPVRVAVAASLAPPATIRPVGPSFTGLAGRPFAIAPRTVAPGLGRIHSGDRTYSLQAHRLPDIGVMSGSGPVALHLSDRMSEEYQQAGEAVLRDWLADMTIPLPRDGLLPLAGQSERDELMHSADNPWLQVSWALKAAMIADRIDGAVHSATPDALDWFGAGLVLLPYQTMVGPSAGFATQLSRVYRNYTMGRFEVASQLQHDYFVGHNLNMFLATSNPQYLGRAVRASAPRASFVAASRWNTRMSGGLVATKTVDELGGQWTTSVRTMRDQFVTSQVFHGRIQSQSETFRLNAQVDFASQKIGSHYGWGAGDRQASHQVIRIDTHEVITPIDTRIGP